MYYYTGRHLSPLINVADSMLQTEATRQLPDVTDCIQSIYNAVVSILKTASSLYVLTVRKGFFKFWWNEEMNLLKEALIEADKLWKSAGKPVFTSRQACRIKYRKCQDNKRLETKQYTNELHDTLLLKNNPKFWQC